jgi:WS/DGAT/MGAT family acyltransferase
MAAAPELAAVAARAHQFLTFSTAPNLQAAVAFGLNQGDSWIAPMKQRFARARDRMAEGLRGVGYTVLDSASTYFQCVDLAASGLACDDEAFAAAAVERAGVAVVPLSAFAEENPPRHMVRLCFAKRDETIDAGVAAMARAGLSPAPPSPFNVTIGPHRRYTWLDLELRRMKAIKTALGGTLNDAVLSAVSLATGRWMRAQGHLTDDLVLRAMVPVSVRADVERGALGNRVAAVYAPLPVGLDDPVETFAFVHDAMGDLKASGQAVGATTLTALADFAPTTILSQAARLQTRQRMFNFVVTNVPGPQFPLYLAGRRLVGLYPVVPLARNTALGIAIMSYDGHLAFGLLGDFEAMAELDALGDLLAAAVDDLERAAGSRAKAGGARGGRRTGARVRPRDAARS